MFDTFFVVLLALALAVFVFMVVDARSGESLFPPPVPTTSTTVRRTLPTTLPTEPTVPIATTTTLRTLVPTTPP